MEGPSQVALFTYDNGTFVAHSFHDEPVEVSFAVKGKQVTDIESGKVLEGATRRENPVKVTPSFVLLVSPNPGRQERFWAFFAPHVRKTGTSGAQEDGR